MRTKMNVNEEASYCGNTHFATVASENRSLTLPPATLRKAAPQKPITNRNIKYTSIKRMAVSVMNDRSHGLTHRHWARRQQEMHT